MEWQEDHTSTQNPMIYNSLLSFQHYQTILNHIISYAGSQVNPYMGILTDWMAVSRLQEVDTQDLLGKSDGKIALVESEVVNLKYLIL